MNSGSGGKTVVNMEDDNDEMKVVVGKYTPSHDPPLCRGIIIASFHDFGTNSMVL